MDSSEQPKNGDKKKKPFQVFREFFFKQPPEPEFYEDSSQAVGINDYVDKRLKPFTCRFYKKANSLIGVYLSFQVIIIVASALIPILNVLSKPSQELQIVSASLGGVIAICTGYLQLIKSSERGILLRIMTGQLQKEYQSYVTNPHQGNDETYRNFIDRAESIILNGYSEYYNLLHQGPTGTKSNGNKKNGETPSKKENINHEKKPS